MVSDNFTKNKTSYFRKIFLSIICMFAGIGLSFAQLLPALQPEQDACNALVICGNKFYTPYSYQGNGQRMDLTNTPCGIMGLAAGEDNAVWLRLEISTAGNIVFSITPEDRRDDYDWAVLDITNGNCNNLSSSQVIRCNFNRNAPVTNNGVTGLDMSSNRNSVAAGTAGQNFCRYISAYTGQVLLIMINNFGYNGNISSGFTIDFSGSSAKFNQGTPPKFDEILKPCETGNKVLLQINKPIKCASIVPNGSDFSVNGAVITSASGINCSANQGYTNQIEINFAGTLNPGNYILNARQGTDNNTLLDLCDGALQLPDSLPFVVPILSTEEEYTICPKQLPFLWNNRTVNNGGRNAATARFVTNMGCDSIVTLHLNIQDTLKAEQDITICPSQLPFRWNGQNINGPGKAIAQHLSATKNGCDSLTFLNLEVQYPQSKSYDLEGCWVVQFNDKKYYQNQIATDTVISSFGCDSIYATLNITVHPPDTVSHIIDTAGCGVVLYKGVTYESSTTLRDTVKNKFGCDSIYQIVYITVYPNEYVIHSQEISQCNKVEFEGKTYYQNTTLRDTFQNVLGCDSAIRLTHIQPEHFQLKITAEPDSPVVGVFVRLNTYANLSNYQVTSWHPENLFSNQHAYEQSFYASQVGKHIYKAVGQSGSGCTDTAVLQLQVDSLIPEVFIPTGFTPNNDGINDVFRPYFVNKSGYQVLKFKIYNRWGQLVYTANRTMSAGWNGTYMNGGQPLDVGVYFYFIDIEFVDGTKYSYKGDVTLIR